MKPTVSVDEWVKLAKEGISRFDKDAALYIRPMYWAERGGPWIQEPDPDSTKWCLSIFEAPMRKPTGFSITLSQFRRPTIESMPVNAKAGCLYPNNARAIFEARSRGFDNAVMCDLLGNVAELATSNIFMGKDGVVYTPAINGTFLAGITRQRVIGLLRQDGVTVVEKTLRYGDFQAADEIFSTGNYSKVVPVTRIDDRPLPMGSAIHSSQRALLGLCSFKGCEFGRLRTQVVVMKEIERARTCGFSTKMVSFRICNSEERLNDVWNCSNVFTRWSHQRETSRTGNPFS